MKHIALLRPVLASVLGAALLAACAAADGSGASDSGDADTPSEVEADSGPDAADTGEDPHALTVMTFNVLCSFCDPAYDPWEDRLAYFADVFERHQPDILGLQELFWAEEVDQVLAVWPGYEAVYYLGEKGPLGFDSNADATILYRADRFELVDHGSFWLGPEPEEPWSGGWADGNLPRLVTWAQLRQRSDGRDLFVVNTHFDNNPPNQEMSAPLLVERVRPHAADMPVVVTGDFNSEPDTVAYATLTAEAPEPAQTLIDAFVIAGEHTVLHHAETEPPYAPEGRIDHVFLAGDAPWACDEWRVDLYTYGASGLYPSDHRAISVRLRF